MKKKIFGMFMFLILLASFSVTAFASTIEDSTLYVHSLADANASEFARMGITVYTGDTLSSFLDYQRSRSIMPHNAVENCVCCGNLLIVNLLDPSNRVLAMPSITRSSQAAEVQISEADVDILLDFVANLLDIPYQAPCPK